MTQRMSNGSMVMNNEVASVRKGIALVWFTIPQNLPEEVLKISENIKKIRPNPRYESWTFGIWSQIASSCRFCSVYILFIPLYPSFSFLFHFCGDRYSAAEETPCCYGTLCFSELPFLPSHKMTALFRLPPNLSAEIIVYIDEIC
jgi:hypothetical protein